MILKDISDRFHDFNIYETRFLSDSYVEIVLSEKDIPKSNKLLHELLGPPAKEAAGKPSKEMQALTNEHGGISIGQTLYLKNSEDGLVAVMLWPWRDGNHTTLKMFISEEKTLNLRSVHVDPIT